MPALISLSLNDGVQDNTFSPMGIDNVGVASYRNLSGGVAAVAPKATLAGLSRATAHKVVATLKFPLETTDEGGRTIHSGEELFAKFEIRLPHAATSTERAAFLASFRDLLGDAAVDTIVSNLESMY